MCYSCLVDIAVVDSESNSDNDFNCLPTYTESSSCDINEDLSDPHVTTTLGSGQPSTSGLCNVEPANVCNVCLLQSIPVGR